MAILDRLELLNDLVFENELLVKKLNFQFSQLLAQVTALIFVERGFSGVPVDSNLSNGLLLCQTFHLFTHQIDLVVK